MKLGNLIDKLYRLEERLGKNTEVYIGDDTFPLRGIKKVGGIETVISGEVIVINIENSIDVKNDLRLIIDKRIKQDTIWDRLYKCFIGE